MIDPNEDPIVDVIHNIRQELQLHSNENNDEHSDNNNNNNNPYYDLCEKIYIGYETSSSSQSLLNSTSNSSCWSIDQCLQIISEQQIDYMVHPIAYFDHSTTTTTTTNHSTTTPLTNHDNNENRNDMSLLDQRPMSQRHNIQSTELLFRTTDWSNRIVAKINSIPFDCLSSANKDGENVDAITTIIERELAWAYHLSVPAVVLPCPTSENIVAYANVLMKNTNAFCAFWIRVPVDRWNIWNELKSLCQGSDAWKNMLPMVELVSFDDDDDENDKEEERESHEVSPVMWQRWFGEVLKVCVLPLSALEHGDNLIHFTQSGRNGYMADFIKKAFRHELQIVLSGTPINRNGGLRPYVDAINHLYDECEMLTEVEAFEKPYRDFLQAPLQPLHHNLESQTYEVFEKDPVKYALYQQAIKQALIEKYSHLDTVVVMVVGAGRGPLVKATIRAARQAQKKVKIYAVEKNPNALVTLHHFKNTIWKYMDVHIVESDMRVWQPEELADIIVSELLGSFGDNELSPECLDGAQRLLKPDTGISIPSSYRSYLSPLMSAKMHHEVMNVTPTKVRKAFETAYVVNVFSGLPLCEPQECFSFEHPNNKHPINNSRHTVLNFELPECVPSNQVGGNEMVIHGLIGYFECTLYGDVLMSILPKSFSEGMFSWFPILFPVRDPMSVKSGAKIQVHMYRCVDKTKVWYEWTIRDLTSHQVVPMHNVGGRSYSIAL